MEGTTEDCFFLDVNWTIDNFSCWNVDIHHQPMTTYQASLSREGGLIFELYPRGLSGHEEQLVVCLCATRGLSNAKDMLGDLCFIGPDGCILCILGINGKEMRKEVLELPPGPKFRDVVKLIRKNEPVHEDQLTLRFRVRIPKSEERELFGHTHYMNSTVAAFKTSVKVHFEPLEENSEANYAIEYPLEYCRMEKFYLVVRNSETAAYSIEMRSMDATEEPKEVKFAVRSQLSLLSSDGSVLRTEENEHVFLDKEEWVISNSLTKEEVSRKGYSVIIDFTFIPSISHTFLSSHVSQPKKVFEQIATKAVRSLKTASKQHDDSADDLKTDLMCLYKDQGFSDFQLKCGTFSFPVHKNILSARSPVFKDMFSSGMREAASNDVDIEDMDPSTLGLFLTHLYTGAVKEELQGESALKLYYAAEKYHVPSLLRKYSDFLCSTMSLSNVCDILLLADKHQNYRLKSVAHDFILKNFNEVLASEPWERFMKSEPLLALETLTEFAKNKKVIRGAE